jgi:hypothetical protein
MGVIELVKPCSPSEERGVGGIREGGRKYSRKVGENEMSWEK